MQLLKVSCIYNTIINGGACGVMVIVVGNEHGNTSSNPGPGLLHFYIGLGKGMNPIILPPVMGK